MVPGAQPRSGTGLALAANEIASIHTTGAFNMAANLLESVNSYLTPDLISKAASYLHESPANTATALSGIVPTLLGGVTNMASTSAGASQLAGLLNSGGHDGSILTNVSSLFSGGNATISAISQGGDLLRTLFGGRVDNITSSISSFSGIGRTSASSLMALAAPLVLGVIGKARATQGLNPASLANLLTTQKNSIASAMPAGLANLNAPSDVEGLRSVTVAPMVVQESRRAWWPLLLLALAGLGLLAYLFGRSRPAAPTVAAYEQVKLCGGDTLNLMSGSFNYNVARYLVEGSDSELPKTFVFDNLNFDSATTNLTPPSRQTVNDLVVVLKSCPNAQVQLAGYTDNTGDPASNQALSQNRAGAIKDMLVAGGIAPERMTTVGYGQDRPIASNDTEDGKARNRRTELVVLKR